MCKHDSNYFGHPDKLIVSGQCHHQTACVSSGRPNVGIDIGSIKPWQTVLVGALGLVAAGKPVTGDKRFPGDFSVTLPGIKTGLAQVCVLQSNITV